MDTVRRYPRTTREAFPIQGDSGLSGPFSRDVSSIGHRVAAGVCVLLLVLLLPWIVSTWGTP